MAIKPGLTYNFRQKMPVRNQGYDICFHSFRICQFLWTFLSFVFSLILLYFSHPCRMNRHTPIFHWNVYIKSYVMYRVVSKIFGH